MYDEALDHVLRIDRVLKQVLYFKSIGWLLYTKEPDTRVGPNVVWFGWVAAGLGQTNEIL